jgi:hypothetical protein
MSSRIRAILVIGLVVAGFCGCASRHEPPPQTQNEPQEPRTAFGKYPVIVRLVARRSTITVTAGPHGPLYSSADESGRPVVSNSTLEQLRTDHPDVYRQVEPTLALDARVDF